MSACIQGRVGVLVADDDSVREYRHSGERARPRKERKRVLVVTWAVRGVFLPGRRTGEPRLRVCKSYDFGVIQKNGNGIAASTLALIICFS